ncbi:chitinase 9-like [Castanea sativa]|uniref:chitinase 9-like n=1 Tax=Castanea sativa TaxID=21020 RepID=UPI003F651BB0
MGAAPVTGSIPTMLSSLLPDLSNIESLRKCPLNIQTFVTHEISIIGWPTINYNYASAGKAIREDLINNPDSVATDIVISLKTAIWFWKTPQDISAGQVPVPGSGAITNIVNGGLECGRGHDDRVASRIRFYKKYCDIMGLSYGNNSDCYNQSPFA